MSDFKDTIKQMCEGMRTVRQAEYYTLGQLIKELEGMPQDSWVYIKPYNLITTGFDSYRGYYEDLALNYALNKDSVTVGMLLKWAKNTINKKLLGYKGGEFLMTDKTPVWLSNYGECSDVRLSEVKDTGYGYVYLYGTVVED